MMNLIIERNNTQYDLDELGITTTDFVVSYPEYEHTFEKIDGMNGLIDLGSTIHATSIRGEFYFEAETIENFTEKRDLVFEIFDSGKPFYITDTRQPYKRWFVKVNNPFEIEQVLKYGLFNIEFISIKGYAESIGTSIQAKTFTHLQDLPVTYTDYTMRATKFKIYNPGQPIDPRNINHYLKITYKGNSENLRIKNLTTGDEWAYLGVTNPEDEIVLEGIRSTKNGLSIFRQTNKRLITLAHGWNEFEIYGAPDAREYAVQANLPRKRVNEIDKKNPITFEFKFMF